MQRWRGLFVAAAMSLTMSMPTVITTVGNVADVRAAAPGTAEITGVVRDSSGVGIDGVVVNAYQNIFSIPVKVTTSGGGLYTLPLQPGATYGVWFDGSTAGYRSEWYDNISNAFDAQRITLADGETRVLDAVLTVTSSVAGRVLNTAGQPVESQVTLYPTDGRLTSALGTTNGQFTINDLEPGDYYLYVTPFEFFPAPTSIYAPEYYGGAYDEAGATVIHVGSGEHLVGQDVVVDVGATITGRLTRSDTGDPVAGATVSIHRSGVPSAFGWWVRPVTDDNGVYTVIGLPTADIDLLIDPEADTGLGAGVVGPTPVIVGQTIHGKDVAVERGVDVTASLYGGAGPLVPNQGRIATACASPGLVVSLVQFCADLQLGSVDANGATSTVRRLAPGRSYNLQAIDIGANQFGVPFTFVPASGTSAVCVLVVPGASVAPSCTSTPVAPGATILGRVVGSDGLGVAGAKVSLLVDASTVVPTMVTTGPLGYYRMPGVPLGTYRVRVTPPTARPDLLTEFRSAGEAAYDFASGDELVVAAATTITGVNVRLDQGATGVMHIRRNGALTSGFGIAAVACRAPAQFVGAVSCSGGQPVVLDPSNLAPGDYEIWALDYFQGLVGERYQLHVGSGDTFVCDLELIGTGSTCTVTPALVDSDGIDPAVEQAAPNDGDGNGDTVPDAAQANVTSLADPTVPDPSGIGANYLTLVVAPAPDSPSSPTLSAVTLDAPPPSADPLPAGAAAQTGLLGFDVENLPLPAAGDPPASVKVTVFLPAPANRYLKYDADAPTGHQWIDATELVWFDPLPTTIGAVTRWKAVLTLTDGQFPGDQDGMVNGVIADPGVFVERQLDQTPPTLTCPTGATFVVNDPAASLTVTVSDEEGGSGVAASTVVVPVAATRGGGSVVVHAADLAGNAASVVCNYAVSVRVQGFAAPVSSTSTNVVQAGQAVPMKWRTVDAAGAPVADPGWFVGYSLLTASCSVTADTTVIPVTVDATVSALQYLGDGWWQVNWKTPKSWTSGCRSFRVLLDGSTGPTALFARR